MKRPNITPGPWKEIEGFISGKFSDGRYHDVCDPRCAPSDDDDVFAEMNANAQAIAAVPDLLEALEPFAAYFSEVPTSGGNGTRVSPSFTVQQRQAARAALTKAGYTF